MRAKKTNPNFMNGVPEFLVLNLLTKKEMYGYELVREIRTATSYRLSFEEGCIYPTLHSLESEGYLTSTRKEVNGRRRFYYRITPSGKGKLRKLAADWANLTSGITSAVGGDHGEYATA